MSPVLTLQALLMAVLAGLTLYMVVAFDQLDRRLDRIEQGAREIERRLGAIEATLAARP
jgi:hypothetical protein